MTRQMGGDRTSRGRALAPRDAGIRLNAAGEGLKGTVGPGAGNGVPESAIEESDASVREASGDEDSQMSEAGAWWWTGTGGGKPHGGEEGSGAEREAVAVEAGNAPAAEATSRPTAPLQSLAQQEPRGRDLAEQISAELDAMAEQFPEMLRGEAAHWV